VSHFKYSIFFTSQNISFLYSKFLPATHFSKNKNNQTLPFHYHFILALTISPPPKSFLSLRLTLFSCCHYVVRLKSHFVSSFEISIYCSLHGDLNLYVWIYLFFDVFRFRLLFLSTLNLFLMFIFIFFCFWFLILYIAFFFSFLLCCYTDLFFIPHFVNIRLFFSSIFMIHGLALCIPCSMFFRL